MTNANVTSKDVQVCDLILLTMSTAFDSVIIISSGVK